MLAVGCTNFSQQSTPFVDIGIQYAVAKVIAQSINPVDASIRLTAVADELLATTETQIPVDAMGAALATYFSVDTFAPEDKFLVAMLIAQLTNYVSSLELPEGSYVTTHMIANNVKFGASFYLPR
jgi:hypothetical protein